MRIDYLLKAYRSLDNASNRPLQTEEQRSAIESAIADIHLLGTRSQIEAADRFSQRFVETGEADTSEVLELLRQDLRTELRLAEVPKRSTWLRIAPRDRWAEETARIVHALDQAPAPREDITAIEVRGSASDVSTVEASFLKLNSYLAERFQLADDLQPVEESLRAGHLSQTSTNVVEGIQVLHQLAHRSPSRVSSAEAAEFSALVDAAIYAIGNE